MFSQRYLKDVPLPSLKDLNHDRVMKLITKAPGQAIFQSTPFERPGTSPRKELLFPRLTR